MKKSYLISSVTVAVIAIVIVIFRFLPGKYITGVLGEGNALSSAACSYPVKVSGDSMAPYFKNGQTAYFNKCLEGKEIGVNTIILFSEGRFNRIGVISGIENSRSEAVYKVIQPNREGAVSEVAKNQITAVYEK